MPNLFLTLFSTLIALSLVPVIASADDTNAGILALQDRLGFAVVKSFETPAPGLSGYVVKMADGKTGIVYGIGDYVIAGTLLDAKGNDLTKKYAATQLPKPDYEEMAQALAQDPYLVSEGREGAPEIYVFADPNCIFCHKFWKQTRDWVADGKVQLHWVMVGFLKPSSLGYSAAILTAEDRAAALQMFEESFGQNSKESGLQELSPIPTEIEAVLEKHLSQMAAVGFSGTPGLLYKGVDGEWRGQTGVPQQDTLGKALGIAE